MVGDNKIEPVIGVIGGSGLYEIDGLENKEWRRCESPWGSPSDELLFGTLEGVRCVFLPRHGRGHPIPPSHLNYRTNIDALKRAGVTDIISLSAVGSLKEELAPGNFVLVDQFIDLTQGRARTFFEEGCVAHVSMAEPVSTRMMRVLAESAEHVGISHKRWHLCGHRGAAILHACGEYVVSFMGSIRYWDDQHARGTSRP